MDMILDDEGTSVIAIRLDKNRIPIRHTPLSEIKPILEAFKTVTSVCDLSNAKFPHEKVEPDLNWTEDDFKELWRRTTKKQRIFLRKVLEYDRVPTGDIVRALEDAGYTGSVPQTVSGLRSGLTKHLKNMGKAQPVEQEWKEDEGQNYYWVKERYRDLLKKVSKQTR